MISTPPIGEMNALVKDKANSVGIEKISQKPFVKSICGYQVRIILIKKAKDQLPKSKLAKKWIVGMAFIKIGVTKL